MLEAVGKAATRWMDDRIPWTNVYGLARTLLASATALTLALNPADVLFGALGPITESASMCQGARALSLFCLIGADRLELARWLAAGLLLLVATGWRPRWTGILHWWLSLSVFLSVVTVDGGDQVAAVLTLLLLPVTLTDPRRWHWQQPQASVETRPVASFVAWSALGIAVRLQVAGIYFHAAVGKVAVEQWVDGTATYYWFTHPYFGAPGWQLPILLPVLLNGTLVALLSWSVILLEFLLAAALVIRQRYWAWLLAAGLALHAGILVIHGLFSFALTMFGALILFLRPADAPFSLPTLQRNAGVPTSSGRNRRIPRLKWSVPHSSGSPVPQQQGDRACTV
jgi:antimicrobial peptide system SdpB family protein